MPDPHQLDAHFPRVTRFDPAVPTWCCTPHAGRSLHRFFDTSAVSPDGRRLAVFRLPFEDRLNAPGDAGEVVVVDLQRGGERVVAVTAGWEPQMGANLNWADDDHLVFNDVNKETWTPQVVKLNLDSGADERWPGGVYHVSPDGRHAAAASTEKMRRTQLGYGVLVPDAHSRRNVGVVDDDGLFITDLQTGARRLVLSLADAARHIDELSAMPDRERAEWEVYGFHAKWSPTGERVLFTVRRYRHAGRDRFNAFDRRETGETEVRFDVLTCRPDGSDVRNALPAPRWERGGHHVNWLPDGARLSANIRLTEGGPLSLIAVDLDGGNFETLCVRTPGSGHPTVHPNGRHILTDTYAHEDLSYGDGTVPLRWIDRTADTEEALLRTGSRVEPENDRALRVDAHPAWDRSWGWVVFNGTDESNTRRAYLADLRSRL